MIYSPRRRPPLPTHLRLGWARSQACTGSPVSGGRPGAATRRSGHRTAARRSSPEVAQWRGSRRGASRRRGPTAWRHTPRPSAGKQPATKAADGARDGGASKPGRRCRWRRPLLIIMMTPHRKRHVPRPQPIQDGERRRHRHHGVMGVLGVGGQRRQQQAGGRADCSNTHEHAAGKRKGTGEWARWCGRANHSKTPLATAPLATHPGRSCCR